MRSSNSALLGMSATVSESPDDLSSWTPEAIGRGDAPELASRVVRKAIDEAVRAAVDGAEAQAREREEEIRREAEERCERLVRESYDSGHEEGRAEGELAEGARLRTAVAATREALDELRAGEVRWSGTIEENICALAVVIARQVLGRELTLDIEPVAELVRTALQEFPIDQPIRIRVNPSDLTALSSVDAIDANPLAAVVEDRDARWLPDASIAPGGCMVEGRERIIDGRVDTALERVYRRLTYTNA
ncbi:MAG: FliH/SctL family protein [Gemmatimonadota bacterium]